MKIRRLSAVWQYKVVEKFLWFPMTLGVETRFWCKASFIVESFYDSNFRGLHWKNSEWLEDFSASYKLTDSFPLEILIEDKYKNIVHSYDDFPRNQWFSVLGKYEMLLNTMSHYRNYFGPHITTDKQFHIPKDMV